MKQTAVEWLVDRLSYTTSEGNIISHSKNITDLVKEAKEMQEIEKLKRQLFMGKVIEIIGMDKTIELWKECIETFKSE
jgi:hypothetical protein